MLDGKPWQVFHCCRHLEPRKRSTSPHAWRRRRGRLVWCWRLDIGLAFVAVRVYSLAAGNLCPSINHMCFNMLIYGDVGKHWLLLNWALCYEWVLFPMCLKNMLYSFNICGTLSTCRHLKTKTNKITPHVFKSTLCSTWTFEKSKAHKLIH